MEEICQFDAAARKVGPPKILLGGSKSLSGTLLRSLKQLYKGVGGKKLCDNYVELIDNFCNSYHFLNKIIHYHFTSWHIT